MPYAPTSIGEAVFALVADGEDVDAVFLERGHLARIVCAACQLKTRWAMQTCGQDARAPRRGYDFEQYFQASCSALVFYWAMLDNVLLCCA
jgi:hypothetical protein